jgi:hypothetical protein
MDQKLSVDDNILSRSQSEDTTTFTVSSSASSKKQPWPTVTPVKVVTRLRPLVSGGEHKEAVFVDWSSVSNDQEHKVVSHAQHVGHQQQATPVKSKPISIWGTPPRHHNKDTPHYSPEGVSSGTAKESTVTDTSTGVPTPSPSKLPNLSRNRWNQPPNTTPVPKSLIVESSSSSLSPSSSPRDPSQTHQARHFAFDAVLPPDMSQAQAYHQTVGNAVRRNLFRGYNTTVCAYGQVGAGKSYTMYGPSSRLGDDDYHLEQAAVDTDDIIDDEALSNDSVETIQDDDGIMPRAMKDVFDAIPEYSDYDVSLKMSFVEIYKDELKDLLADRSPPLPLQLYDYHHEQGHVVVQGLCTVPVDSLAQALCLIQMAQRRRTCSRSLSHVSSRSHAICTLHVTMTPRTTTVVPTGRSSTNQAIMESTIRRNTSSTSTKRQRGLTAKLTLVDLAGSERLVHSPTKKHRASSNAETITINKDLFVLGKVVAALASPSVVHVPYRDSKLTRILRDSLGGKKACRSMLTLCHFTMF